MPKLSFHPTIDPLQRSKLKANVFKVTQGLYDQTESKRCASFCYSYIEVSSRWCKLDVNLELDHQPFLIILHPKTKANIYIPILLSDTLILCHNVQDPRVRVRRRGKDGADLR